MKKYILLGLLLIGMQSSAQNIIRMEYFFDTDPGFGNGISLPLTPDTAVANLSANIDLSNLHTGEHTLFIRSKGANGKWSLTNKKVFAKLPFITAIEYFFDTDPGFGNGIQILISTDTAISNLNANVNLNGLTQGEHTLFIRSRDADGIWSLTNKRTFTYCTLGASYFYQDLDHDGYGTLSDSVLACTVPIGYALNHTDCDDNDSSMHQQFPFYLDNDHDNYGNGSLIMVCAQNDTTPPLGYGLHFGDCDDNDSTSHQQFLFYIDNDGDHQGTGTTTYLLCAPAANLAPPGYAVNNTDCDDNNSAGQFFFPFYIDADEDGFIASLNTVNLCVTLADIVNPPQGYQSQNFGIDCDDNDWNLRMTFPFYVDADQDGYGIGNLVQVCAIHSGAPPLGYSLQNGDCDDNDANIYPGKMDQMEYYLDSDPGVGQGISMNITGLNIDSLSVTFPIMIPNNLQPGFHILAMRAHTCGLNWGLFEQRSFNVTAQDISPRPIVTGEYFIDTDPGVGNAISFSIPTSDTLNQMVSITVPANTPPGNHPIGIRFKDSLGQWGHFETTYITVFPPPLPTYPIVAAEYFIDNDPGLGNANALSISPTDTLVQTFSISIPSNLNEGHHLLSIRVKNSQGEWSLFEHRTIYISAPLQDPNPIVAAEYFIDTDPGLGNGTPFAISTVDTLDTNVMIPLPSNLSFGQHYVAIRVKNQAGEWSMFNHQLINIVQSPAHLPGSGNAITLDGNDDYIQLPSVLEGVQQFTIDFWIKTTENRSSNAFWQKPTIMGNANPSAPDGDFGITTNNGMLGIWSGICSCGDQELQTTKVINDNQWHHVAVVNNGSTMVLYVDGMLLPGNIPTTGGTLQNAARPWRIGMNNSCCVGNFPHAGSIDELRMWNTAMNIGQIRNRMCKKISLNYSIYNTAFSDDSLAQNLAYYLNMDETTGTTLINAGFTPSNADLQNGATRERSGAAIGNDCISVYPTIASSNTQQQSLFHYFNIQELFLSFTPSPNTGFQIYSIYDLPEDTTGLNMTGSMHGYYGVFPINVADSTFDIKYLYNPNFPIYPGSQDHQLALFSKESNTTLTWTNANGILDTVNDQITIPGKRCELVLGNSPQLHLNLQAFLQGYYQGSGIMASALFNQGVSLNTTIADTIEVLLYQSGSMNMLFAQKEVIGNNGWVDIKLPTVLLGQSAYVVIKHRNSIETWSATPITILSSTTYNFTTAATQAYGNNQIEVEPGIWAFYSGDINQDGAIDAFDYIELDPDIINGNGGYLTTDLNGDGVVDSFDYILFDPNLTNGVGMMTP